MQSAHGTLARQCKVLVAEDIPSNATLTLEVLSHANCCPLLVTNGRQALAACQEQEFHLILMDVHMPEMNGIQATAAIRQWEREAGIRKHYIVAVTASAMPHEITQCIQAGMDQILTKPISITELLAVVHRACSKD